MSQDMLSNLVKKGMELARRYQPERVRAPVKLVIGDKLEVSGHEIAIPEQLLRYERFLEGFLAVAIAVPVEVRSIPEVVDIMFYNGLKQEAAPELVELWKQAAATHVSPDFNPLYALPSWDMILGGKFVESVIEELWRVSEYGIRLDGASTLLLFTKMLWEYDAPLTYTDIRILKALSLKPTASGREIAKMISTPKSTVLNRVKKLRSRNWLKIVIVVNYPMIGLEHKAVLAEVPSVDFKSIEEAKALLDTPYTRYVTIVYGGRPTIYAILTIPFHLEQALRALLNKATREGVLSSYKLITLLGYNSFYNFTSYIPKVGWRSESMGWVMWMVNCLRRRAKAPMHLYSYEPFEFDKLDLMIIREMQRGLLKPSEIARALRVDGSEVGERKRQLERHGVISYLPAMAFDGLKEFLVVLAQLESRDVAESFAAGLTILPYCSYALCSGDVDGVLAPLKLPSGGALSYMHDLECVSSELSGVEELHFYVRWGMGGVHRLLPVEMYSPDRGWVGNYKMLAQKLDRP